MTAKADDSTSKPARRRKPRSDGLRNRELVIAAAKTAFTELGPLVSLDAIARAAGVGIGTLYRHFPTRDALIEEVFRHEVEQLADAAGQLLEQTTPLAALHQWMRLYVDYISTNKVLASAVSSMFGISGRVYRSSVAQITDNPVLGAGTDVYRSAVTLFTEAAALLLDRATAAGEISTDVTPLDLLRALSGFTATYGDEVEGWEGSALRLVNALIEGLRTRPA